MREYWDRYGWVLVLAFIVVMAQPLLWGTEPFCSKLAEENCFREWMNVAGTWLAAFAALGGLLFVAIQIDQASRQHTSVMRIQAQPLINLARRIPMRCFSVEYVIDGLSNLAGQGPTDDLEEEMSQYAARLETLAQTLNHPDFVEFDRTFVGSWNTIHIITPTVGNLRDTAARAFAAAKAEPGAPATQKLASDVRAFVPKLRAVRGYCRECRDAADQYLRGWERI